MTQDNGPVADGVSRRSVLRKGAATGALIVAGTALSGSAAANPNRGRTGGNMLVEESRFREGVSFTVTDHDGATAPASCQSDNAQEKEHRDMTVIYTEGEPPLALVLVRDNKAAQIERGVEYQFVSSTVCGGTTTHPFSGRDLVRASFRPV